MLMKKLRLHLLIESDLETVIRHHGHRLAGSAIVGQKSPLELQRKPLLLELSTSLTREQMMRHGMGALVDFATSLGLKFSKSSSKAEIVKTILGDSGSIEIFLRNTKGQTITLNVKDQDNINIDDYFPNMKV